ncbi:MAG: hypothetical protein IJU76_07165 [Desulfovibrionaceae bacterium]|nr:hypothetical protein [Desulfovibrionaceae bacterium]
MRFTIVAIYGLKLHAFGQSVYYHADEPLSVGDTVLVQEDNRVCLAKVTSGPLTNCDILNRMDLPWILRPLNETDRIEEVENQHLVQSAFTFCRECIQERKLDMKLVDVDVFFDRSKIIFFFTAPTRIDFRELVKDLVRQYHTRIELRQIGVRHETQMVGSVGNCGMICCCRRYLRNFAPVTIRMAKEQNLFLNPSKISGSCGRLLCCLSYEQENYDKFFSRSPRIGKKYPSTIGTLKVVRTNLFRNSVSYSTEAGEEVEVPLEEWLSLVPSSLDRNHGSDSDTLPDEDLPQQDLYLSSSLPEDSLDDFHYEENDPSYGGQPPERVDVEQKAPRPKRKKRHKGKKH